MAGPKSASMNPGSGDARGVALRELPRKLAYMQTLWQKLLYVHWDAQALELVRRLAHEIRTVAVEEALAETAENARKLEQQLQILQSRNGPPPETERGRLQGLMQRLAHALLDAHVEDVHPSESRAVSVVQQAPADIDHLRQIYILSDGDRHDEPWVVRLRHTGHAVRVCANLAQLRQAMQQRRPDMILAEVALAQGPLAGIEAVDALHSEFDKTTPVIFMASRGDLAARLAAVRAGGMGYFLKPLDEDELLRRIAELLPRKQPNYRVLIVEDEEQLASAYALVLQQAGYVAQVLTQPLQIFQVLQQFRPDLLLMDLHLPECSGSELMQLIRQDPVYDTLPILFLSGDADPASHNSVLSQGADVFLLKPIKPDQLIANVSARIGRARTLRQRLLWLSERDALTGLLNRHALRGCLDRCLAEPLNHAAPSPVLFYIQIDQYRVLRDRLGLAAVDLMLVDLAVGLREKFTGAGCLAYLGEGAFSALAENLDAVAARDLASMICDAMAAKEFSVGRETVSITLSIGVATLQPQFHNGQEWLSAAIVASDIARDAGGARVELQRAAAADAADHELNARYAQLLRMAIEADSFHCVYQPIMSLRGQPGDRYDVLLRAQDADGRALDVQRVFAVAHEEKLLVAIDRWVIGHVLEVLQRRASAGCPTVFFIKLSAQTLSDPETGDWIGDRLAEARIDARQMVFELDAAAVSAGLSAASRLFTRLRGLGCGTALEHFGVSPGSTQLFGHLPVDYVKIDGALARRPDARQRLSSMIEQANGAGVQVIAGFVEDASSLAMLWQYGVQFIQGNFLQEPDTALSFEFRDAVVG